MVKRQAPGGTRHHNFMLCVVLAVPACTLASGWYRPFYKTEKSITGRRAHNPIHPGGCHRRCSSLFCGETTRYSKDLADEGTRCFIDADNMRAVSVLNLGTIDEPGHADNTATLKLKKTAPFSALLSVNGERNSQKSLAEWIEDWADYLVGFDANGDAIQATKAAAAVRKITIEANQTADFEDNDFSGKRSLMESVEAKTKDIMPVAFEFKCVPFEGLKERPFKLRLSIITGDRPVLVLRIIQLEAVQEEMANEFRNLLVEKFKDSKVETFIGTFTA